MSANTFVAPAVNGINGHKSSKIKVADQLNGSSSSSYLNGNASNDEVSLAKVREAARHMVDAASQAGKKGENGGIGLVHTAALKVAGLGSMAVQTTATTLGMGYGVAKALGSFYVNATAAVVGYSAASAAHLARFGVDTTANITGSAVNKTEETLIKGYNKASNLTGYAVGAAGELAEQTVHVAHATAKKILPATIVEKAENVAGVAKVVVEHPESAKGLIPGPVYNTVLWGLGTAKDAKDRTYTTVTSTRTVIRDTATAVVDTARTRLQATEDFAYNKALERYENAKNAIGLGARTAIAA